MFWWLICPIQNDAKQTEKSLKPWQMGTHLRELSESYPMNTNMTGFGWFSGILCPYALDECSLRIGRVNVARKPLFVDIVCLGYLYRVTATEVRTKVGVKMENSTVIVVEGEREHRKCLFQIKSARKKLSVLCLALG